MNTKNAASSSLLFRRLCVSLTIAIITAGVSVATAQSPLTLNDALREARAHNAGLPVAALDTSLTLAGVQAAKGRLWPSVGLDGDVHGGTPSHYASGDARLQLVAEMSLYDGGRLRADIGRARADHHLSVSRYRMAERDLDLQVRVWFAQAQELEEEVTLRERGLDRLRRYIDLISSRREAGEPVSGDLLKAQVQRDQVAADIEESRRRLASALLQLKEVLGREPDDEVVLAAPEPPGPPPPAEAQPWKSTPDVAAGDAARRSAQSAVDAVRAQRRPHLDVAANVGTEPVLGSSSDASLNTGRDEGAEVTLSLAWPLWDRGVYREELAAARLAADQASYESTVVRREARLAWTEARSDLDHLYEIVRLRRRIVPTAEDAYLQAESLYRGGEDTALEVLDAFVEWLQASLDVAQSTFDYRSAEARELRWGTP